MKPGATVLFVYNADSGLANALLDIGHKLVSPATYGCNLCALSHGLLAPRAEWTRFVATLPYPAEFLHRDEFRRRFGADRRDALPAAFVRVGDDLRPLVTAGQMNAARSLDELRRLITRALEGRA